MTSFLNGAQGFKAAVDRAMDPSTPRGAGISRDELGDILDAYVATEGRFFDGGSDALDYARDVKPALAEVLEGVERSTAPQATKLYSSYVGAQVRYDLAQSRTASASGPAPAAPQGEMARARRTIFSILERGPSYATDVNRTASLLQKVMRERRVSGTDFQSLRAASQDQDLYLGMFKASDSIQQMTLQWLRENPSASKSEFEGFLRQLP